MPAASLGCLRSDGKLVGLVGEAASEATAAPAAMAGTDAEAAVAEPDMLRGRVARVVTAVLPEEAEQCHLLLPLRAAAELRWVSTNTFTPGGT